MTPDYSKIYGQPWLLYHRVDLHNELKRTATEPRPHTSNIASIELSAEVSDIDLDGHITFRDGRRVKKDVIVVADGIRVRSPVQDTSVKSEIFFAYIFPNIRPDLRPKLWTPKRI